MPDPASILASGREILDPVLANHGFSWRSGPTGAGSGGRFARAEYLRGDRRIELHIRVSLGMVRYHVGPNSVLHSDYMRTLLGPNGGNHYPGFSVGPLDAFHHLAHDLTHHCSAFLIGTAEDFDDIVRRATAEAASLTRRPLASLRR